MDLSQRNHIFALKAFSGAHAGLVVRLQANLTEVLYEGYEDILGVVFLKGKVGSGQVFRRGCFLGGG